MNKADVEFTVGLNTSPAERQLDLLDKKVKASSHIYSQVFKDMGPGGFKMVGQPYQNGNNFVVPSVQVLERSLSTVTNAMEKFARIVETISMRTVNFTTVGNPYTSAPRTVYASSNANNVAGYIPYNSSPNIRPWYPTEHYTHSQVNSINNPEKVFDYIIQKRKSEQNNPYMGVYGEFSRRNSAQGMYNTFMSVFGNAYDATRSILGLPAPKAEEKKAEDNSTPEEQAKDVVEEDKKDNDELKGKLLLWSKILATVYALRKVLEGLGKLWKFGAETVSNVNSNINEESGYFSVDPEGALKANSYKTRAMIYAGIRNMGKDSPLSKSGFDYSASKITDVYEAAMAGRNVDQRTTTDVQRLKDYLGIDLTPASLLTGIRNGKTATDYELDIMDKFETQISDIAKYDEITKGQIYDSLRNVLGDEMVNAIVANSNKNLKISDPNQRMLLSELLISKGGSAIPSGNLTESTDSAVKSIGELNEAVSKLKNTLVTELSPAFVVFTDTLSGIINWINRKLNKVSGTKDAKGQQVFRTSVASLTDNVKTYDWYKQTGKKDSKDKFENKEARVAKDMQSDNAYDLLEALWLSQPEAVTAEDIEGLGIEATQSIIGKGLINGGFDENSQNPVVKALANYERVFNGVTYRGYNAIKQEAMLGLNGMNDTWFRDFFKNPSNYTEEQQLEVVNNILKNHPQIYSQMVKAFSEGGALDYGTGMNVARYLLNPAFYSSADEMFAFIAEMKKQAPEVLDNTFDIDPTWKDTDKNGKIDFGEVGITLVVKDQYGDVIHKENITSAVQ